MMKLTWVGPYLPAPEGSGADLRSFYLLKTIVECGAQVEGLFLGRHGSQSEKYLTDFSIYSSNGVMKAIRTIFGGILGIPLRYNAYYHPQIEQDLKGKKMAYVDHLHMSVNLPESLTAKSWLDEHNLEYILWKEYAESRIPPLSQFVDWEANRVKRFEYEQIYEMGATGIPSSEQRNTLPEELQKKVHVIPNGVPDIWLEQGENRLQSAVGTLTTLGFIGGYNWKPNRIGTEVFLAEVWPGLIENNPNLELVLAGSGAPSHWSNYEGVKTIGFVPTSKKFFEQIDLLIVPLNLGSGTRLKILEATARGVPFLSTEKGSEGLKFDSIPTAPTIRDLGPLIKDYLEAPGKLDNLRKQAFNTVSKQYRWSRIGERLYTKLTELI